MMKSIRSLGQASLAAAFCVHAAGGANGAAAPALTLVRDGVPAAAIVVAAEAAPEVKEAAARLAALIEQATGARLAVGTEPVTNLASIFVGPSPHVTATFAINQRALKADDAFDIAFPAPNCVVILGRAASGTAFGVAEFLERYVGVRWLMPGPFGTDVPKHRTLTVPAVAVRQTPSFESRLLSIASRRNAAHEWADRNRMIARMEGAGHNLNNLFSFQEYADHPEYFPMMVKKYRLKPSGKQGWQPCFDPAVTAGPAIERIADYFTRGSERHSYSLAISDKGTYCRCPVCAPGMQGYNYSDTYYRWVNAVVEGVLAQHPDKQFGLLAYNNVIAPPSFAVNPAVVPWITQDRLKWIDPEVRRAGEALTRAWRAKVPVIAWYDYIYGAAYLLPRVYFHQMAETLRFGHANGVRHYYAEAYPDFGEGPKLYVLLKLLWNIDADVDALLTEWYERVGGQEAAPFLARYYANFESFWTKRILQSAWYQRSGIYMPAFGDPDYLMDIAANELATCRELLEQALEKAQTPDQQARVRTLFDAFQFYEASALAYQGGTPQAIKSPRDALNALDGAIRAYEQGQRRVELATVDFPKNPVLALSDKANRLNFGPERGLWYAFTAVLRWAGANPGPAANSVRARVEEITEQYKGSELGDLARVAVMVAEDPDRLIERAVNGSFDAANVADAGAPTDWSPRAMPKSWYKWVPAYYPDTEVRWLDAQARSGDYCMKISGPGQASVLQQIPVTPGDAYLVSVALNGKLEDMEGRAGFSVQWHDDRGRWAGGTSATLGLRPGTVTDGWITRESTLIRVPKGVASMVLSAGLVSLNPEDFLMVDDASAKQVVMD